MNHLNLYKAAIALLAVTAAGCGMPGGTSGIGPVSSNARPVAAPLAAAPLAAPDAHKKLAGKYEGTIEWTIGSETISGTLSLILRFHNKNILGPFKITQNGETEHFRFYGRIKSKTANDALIIFLVYNKIKGGYATGSGNIVNGTFSADAKSKAVGSNPSIPIHFSVTKVPKG
jgi:hypothetical protein